MGLLSIGLVDWCVVARVDVKTTEFSVEGLAGRMQLLLGGSSLVVSLVQMLEVLKDGNGILIDSSIVALLRFDFWSSPGGSWVSGKLMATLITALSIVHLLLLASS